MEAFWQHWKVPVVWSHLLLADIPNSFPTCLKIIMTLHHHVFGGRPKQSVLKNAGPF